MIPRGGRGGARLGVARFETLLRRLLSVKGQASPDLFPEILPTLALEAERPEWQYLTGGLILSAFGQDVAAVGNVSHFGLTNPATSGGLLVVEKLILTNQLGVQTYYFLAISQAGETWDNISGSWSRDSRASAASFGQAGIRTAVGGLGNAFALVGHLAGEGMVQVLDVPVVLAPGSTFYVRPNATNAEVAGSVLWRERSIEASERR